MADATIARQRVSCVCRKLRCAHRTILERGRPLENKARADQRSASHDIQMSVSPTTL